MDDERRLQLLERRLTGPPAPAAPATEAEDFGGEGGFAVHAPKRSRTTTGEAADGSAALVVHLQGQLEAAQAEARVQAARSEQLAGEAERLRRCDREHCAQHHVAAAQLARTAAELQRTAARRRAAQERARLGAAVVQRTGTVLQEAWEDGPAFRDVADRLAELAGDREGAARHSGRGL